MFSENSKGMKNVIKKVVVFLITIGGIILPFVKLFNPKLCISVINERIILDSKPMNYMYFDNNKLEHDSLEEILFSSELYMAKVILLSLEIKNKGKESVEFDDMNPVKLIFNNLEIVSKPIIKNNFTAFEYDYLTPNYPDTIVLPNAIMNPRESYNIDIALIHRGIFAPEIKVSGKVINQNKIILHNIKYSSVQITNVN